eukprot:TRINITY_DN16984_c0_g1_i1.p1 TRINITY_DN16984_c0_g1~~TRINITY_DN16984_c0_g1_i1.p1  ORF type:complete len:679 (-),score=137.71 TRINITY_DN16984_c0_g1_i1:168-2204(-)
MSVVHAACSVFAALMLLFVFPPPGLTFDFASASAETQWLHTIVAGYYLWQSFNYMSYRFTSSSQGQCIAHHVAVAFVYSLSLAPFSQRYGLYFLLQEASSGLLSMRSLLLSEHKSSAVLIEKAGIASFFGIRLGIGIPMSVAWWHQCLLEMHSTKPHSVGLVLCFMVFNIVLNALNLYWGGNLLRKWLLNPTMQVRMQCGADDSACVVGDDCEIRMENGPSSPRKRPAAKPLVLRIHGARYDLTKFASAHPGGRGILESAAVTAKDDATALFESYHALSTRRAHIDKIMTTFKLAGDVEAEPFPATFLNGGFYHTLREKVKAHLQQQQTQPTTISAHKVGALCMLKCCAFLAVLLVSAWHITNGVALGSSNWTLVAWAAVMATSHSFLGFCVMHDASHYAVSSIPVVNELLSRVCNASQLWSHDLWARHHVYAHHSYTGDQKNDPDTKHGRPFIRKHISDPLSKYIAKSYSQLPAALRQAYQLTVMGVFPGMFVGQILVYAMSWKRGHVWGVSLPKIRWFGSPMAALEHAVLWGVVSWHLRCLWYTPVATFAYFAVWNLLYFASIAPDHDTFEVSVPHQQAQSQDPLDWGEMQVRASGDFCTENPWVHQCFGGINYQIEHHLFPSMSHAHYPAIAPLVRQECARFKIPYSCQTSWVGALRSYCRMLDWVSENTPSKVD